MITPEQFKTIRLSHKLSQSQLAALMNYNNAHISHMENGTRAITEQAYQEFKRALNIEDVPLTLEEKKAFSEELGEWSRIIHLRNYETAEMLAPDLKRRIDLSGDERFQRLYAVNYSYLLFYMGRLEERAVVIDFLHSKEAEMTDREQSNFISVLIGDAYIEGNYKKALKLAMKQVESEKNLGHEIGHACFNVATALAEMGYNNLALHYTDITEAAYIKDSMFNYLPLIQRVRAVVLGRAGKIDEAQKIIENCNKQIKLQKNDEMLPALHFTLGRMFYEEKMYDQSYASAILAKNLFDRLENGVGNASSQNNMCLLVDVCMRLNKIDEAMAYAETCLSYCTKDDIWSVLIHTSKHSITLDQDASVEYIEKTAIPILIEVGLHNKAIEYLDMLSDLFEDTGKRKAALEFSKKSIKIYRQMMEGDLSL